ncbi:hypothetical protein VOLCADRAFT_97138 [Volvox carteri f. nagariensis]|uniref:Uncharacterized protein n=1 Tax=Volvox carteri f. nagariensis TaxID=3068 RepID=D8UBZ5_VOLCA|nr:uncharacterized protein VOLCADRAFT_97138 [Volvox carteri f. nagariensis]EFJ42756.1 hypothetical protein VOLCADRAFT_97138 [Volvox carteri f. nagariensis]|eukprot:XP_002956217.1 hypothetical protein VOLCADRAFT_97138 [Volvox carteri f. nagariensis]
MRDVDTVSGLPARCNIWTRYKEEAKAAFEFDFSRLSSEELYRSFNKGKDSEGELGCRAVDSSSAAGLHMQADQAARPCTESCVVVKQGLCDMPAQPYAATAPSGELLCTTQVQHRHHHPEVSSHPVVITYPIDVPEFEEESEEKGGNQFMVARRGLVAAFQLLGRREREEQDGEEDEGGEEVEKTGVLVKTMTEAEAEVEPVRFLDGETVVTVTKATSLMKTGAAVTVTGPAVVVVEAAAPDVGQRETKALAEVAAAKPGNDDDCWTEPLVRQRQAIHPFPLSSILSNSTLEDSTSSFLRRCPNSAGSYTRTHARTHTCAALHDDDEQPETEPGTPHLDPTSRRLPMSSTFAIARDDLGFTAHKAWPSKRLPPCFDFDMRSRTGPYFIV